MQAPENTGYKIRLTTLVALSAAGVFSVANNGDLATVGPTLITYLLIAAVGYLLPCVLVTGELGSRIQGSGGIFDWVAAGFGDKWGVAAAGAQWAQNLPFLPYAFAFAAACVASIFDPSLMSNKWWTFFIMLLFIWGGTIVNFFSVKLSSRAITGGFILGNLFPAVALVVLAILWFAKGEASVTPMQWSDLAPEFNLDQLMIFTGVMLALFGIEVAAPLAKKVENPRKTFPLAMGVSAVVIVLGYALSVLPISVVLPIKDISLEYGTLTAFQKYFDFLGVSWMLPVMAVLLVLGVASVGLVWILTPARTMQSMSERKLIPHVFSLCNKAGMPVGALLIQAVLSSIFALPVLFLENVGDAFFLSLAAAAQLHLVMYIILFAAFIRVKLTNIPPPGVFVIPGGVSVGVMVSLVGMITCIGAFLVGFIPPTSVLDGGASGLVVYWGVLALTIVVFVFAILHTVRKIKTAAGPGPR